MSSDPRLASNGNSESGIPTSSPPPPPPPPPPPEEQAAVSIPTADGAVDNPSSTPPHPTSTSYKLKFCTVCAANQNRSMEAHNRLAAPPSSYPVISFGTGSLVRLPGPTITQPNVYNFNTVSYSHIYDELLSKDPRLYKSNGVLPMLERNKSVKWGPERFQEWVPGLPRMDHLSRGDKGSLGTEGGVVDVIITCEEKCWDAVVDDLMTRGAPLNRPVHVFNVDIRDNHEEALVGSKAILDLADRLNESADQERKTNGADGWNQGDGAARKGFDERVPEILAKWQEKWPNLPALWTLSWF
ncbi:RNA polymerase II subunit A C-terminal domain phosphatase [Ophidiomyces ophidiicola]|uniref:RNA polymerase II subunit A C-terminal domain phosphatase n=1 Tax=Ophidiomyces ophidiicola TaxID=1387563 RepID=A0ACB8UXE3_9EURO|nr:RNA polymerase II subunit A C-terminal domain phosphatase [Ophidiomyces ophidiicola]KAI1911373.1 RNA polymerase II subunit A C-terminal domain phosphatase [Ophidiomyces ophidiicola]KAI1918479.1 RNA polymerase II subunit A C-terminal domain phosphatase [Ophidiomyces ophidiicola]KAI1926838.1 RNA polymerase II subunit A C-terminal domain phosphatase [Ophidiomyces ophidiicola]KAI1927240.1 RNA polymerase II subunit A C-terminal domain phosphatase [Ophidiomyces ophidiicola]KAI1937702.1 RNA polyme